MAKSADAFRTISEVADWLGTPAHVLRFWESKFSQVKPVKRAGGRRYYRPSDMQLLGGIKKLLHDDGMTIKGVQKILREQGVKHVASFSQPLEFEFEIEGTAAPADHADVAPEPQADETTVVELRREPASEPERDSAAVPPTAETGEEPKPVFEDVANEPLEKRLQALEQPEPEPEIADSASVDTSSDLEMAETSDAEPAVETIEATESAADTPAAPEALRPATVVVPPDPADEDIIAHPSVLSAFAGRRGRKLPPAAVADAVALRAKLVALQERLAAPRPQ